MLLSDRKRPNMMPKERSDGRSQETKDWARSPAKIDKSVRVKRRKTNSSGRRAEVINAAQMVVSTQFPLTTRPWARSSPERPGRRYTDATHYRMFGVPPWSSTLESQQDSLREEAEGGHCVCHKRYSAERTIQNRRNCRPLSAPNDPDKY